ncbi:MAG: hypothetical protein ACO1QB_08400 [Verrucomicrobiales bacterium]
MKKFTKSFALAIAAAAMVISSDSAMAQGQGGGNREEMRQRMLERYKERLEINDEAEWKLISGKIDKVMEARREVGFGGGFGGFGGGRGGRPPGGNDADRGGDRGDRGGRGGGFGGEANAEQEALQKAVESKASNDEIKAKLAKVREVRKQKQAKLEAAQEDLRKVLSVRQEAAAVLNGLLN